MRLSGKQVGSIFLPQEWTQLAFLRAMDAWRRSLRRPDLSEVERVHGALLAYQSQLDALVDHFADLDLRPKP